VTFDFFRTSAENNTYVNVEDDHWKIVREVGAASTVLLKNTNNALPFKSGKDSLRSLAIIGNDAGPGRAGPNQFSDQGGSDGTLAMGWGSGFVVFLSLAIIGTELYFVELPTSPTSSHLTKLFKKGPGRSTPLSLGSSITSMCREPEMLHKGRMLRSFSSTRTLEKGISPLMEMREIERT
jgi:hypothetical protein